MNESLLSPADRPIANALRLGWLPLLGLPALLLFGGCAPIATTTPAPLPRLSPVQTLIGSPAAEAAIAARPAPPQAAAASPPPQPAVTVPVVPLVPTTVGRAPAPAPAPPSEPRFDLIVNNANAREVYLALAADGRYNVLTHPELSGTISVTLRRVTMREALEALRDVYGYDFKVDGRRVTVFPQAMQSRIFVVNYLHAQRSGRSDVRVSSGTAPANGNAGGYTGSSPTPGNGGGNTTQPDSSQITTQSRNDLWAELGEAVKAMIGTGNGRHVIVSPQSGLLAVRAMPDELRQVETMLAAARMAVERQVMLDVKIVQVELREGFQSGIDWSILRGRGAAGTVGGSGSNPLLTNPNGLPTLPNTASLLSDALALPPAGGGLFGLSLATNGFQAVMGFLETHGDVQTLSSPRLATLNNQKAVLKVGTDDYFVTNVSGGSVNNNGLGGTGSNTTTTTLPTLTLTPFFSGIALDVTPQIDEGHMITLHVHPSVSSVSERNKQVDLGTLGAYKLPLASSSINETDTIVRIPDGQIVAIGGLMQMETARQTSGLPGSAENALTASVLGNRANSGRKKELVVLIKPTIIRTAEDWQDQTQAAWAALEGKGEPVRVIRLDGPPQTAPVPHRLVRPAAAESPAVESTGGQALKMELSAGADGAPITGAAAPTKAATARQRAPKRAAPKVEASAG